MTLLLQQIGVSVVGFSLKPEKNSLYDRANLEGKIPEKFADIRNYKVLKKFIEKHKPSVIFHMAAQPLVLESYKIPLETFDVNVMGTANLLDAAFHFSAVKVVVVVTTDKVYRNDNSGQSFVESDPLEGKDPYSASKVGTESVVAAWQNVAEISGGPKIVTVRAGNVIGGGDFGKDRLLPDIIRSFVSKKPLEIRNPMGTRPWQHVLDVNTAYLLTVEKLLEGGDISAINFGPKKESLNVSEIVKLSEEILEFKSNYIDKSRKKAHKLEADSLNLNSNRAFDELNWRPKLNQSEALTLTLKWWKKVLSNEADPKAATLMDIQGFLI